MKNKTLLGFDFGLKRIGVAVGQDVTATATPLKTINAKKGVPHWNEIEELIREWQPAALIVGIPIDIDGSKIKMTKAARNFAKQLYDRFHIQVYEEDERFTTKAARAKIYEQGGYKALCQENIDEVAAKIILEAWMRKNCG